MTTITGKVTGINGNLVTVKIDGPIKKNEVGYILVGDSRLKGEVIRVNGDIASMQIYEMTNGIQVGDKAELTGELMSVELGPGLLSQVYDGLQNPLHDLAEQCGFFLERGVYLDPIPNKDWEFTPVVQKGDVVRAGDTLGTVPEGIFTHRIMVPFDLKGDWTVSSIVSKGSYNVRSTIAVIEDRSGERKELTMVFSWPIKKSIDCYDQRLRPDETLVTQIRCIDTFLPVAKGGTFCVPGPFGAGKTVLQHMEAKNAAVDVVIVAACGERAGEVVEVLKEFPELIDPRTGRSLMERTIIICNTSSMPVAAREASVYTAVTMAEYYRQMGLDVLVLADSTSRWAQATLKVVGAFHGLSAERAGARKYPSIHPIDSWSRYKGIVDMKRVEEARSILHMSNEVSQMMKVVGEEGTSLEDYITYQKGELLDAVYLQQNSFDPVDAACSPERQQREFELLYSILKADYDLKDRREIRAFFNQLRQEFLDWHGMPYKSAEFLEQEQQIEKDGLATAVH